MNQSRLAIDVADELIDQPFIDAAATLVAANDRADVAKRALVDATNEVHRARSAMLEQAIRLGADNAVPGRTVPNMLDAARRRLS